ncbi:hypothetical protein NON00_17740 [Roseomonas sp. GC11]|uniref:hypothetical protein n=1 Tax=Roseomonas sp. GC11 TaxID=2950546 RepID=UPI00210E324F|nr:hypothetical protein [Roseomonas sp. GC11]MCQ4161759.1 hypothetical protein [Roseomonas sp. GC11]
MTLLHALFAPSRTLGRPMGAAALAAQIYRASRRQGGALRLLDCLRMARSLAS